MSETRSPAPSPVGRLTTGLVSLYIAAGGIALVASGIGAAPPVIDLAITAAWVRWLSIAVGVLLLVDSARTLALNLESPSAVGRPHETLLANRSRIRDRTVLRLIAGAALLALLTLGVWLQIVHVSRGAWALWLLTGMVLLLGVLGLGLSSERLVRTSRLASGDGVRGRGTIDEIHDTGWRVNHLPRVRLDLTIALDGRDPYTTRVTDTVPIAGMARLLKGGSLPVLVDPDAPEHVLVLWEEQ